MTQVALLYTTILLYFGCSQAYKEFPFLQFLETAYPSEAIQKFRPQQLSRMKNGYLCSGSRHCSCDCDSLCKNKRSCCIDYLWDPLKPLPLKDYMVKFQNEMERHPKMKCVKVEPFSNLPNFRSTSMNMISTCPRSYKNPEKILCADSRHKPSKGNDKIPVVAYNRLVYKNKYCALCNNVKSYAAMNLTFKCYRSSNIESFTTSSTNPIHSTTTTHTTKTKQQPGYYTLPPEPTSTQSSTRKESAIKQRPSIITTTSIPTIVIKTHRVLNEFTDCAAFMNFPEFSHRPTSCTETIQNCNKPEYSFCHFYGPINKNIHCRACGSRQKKPQIFSPCRTFLMNPPIKFTWSVSIEYTGTSTKISANHKNGKNSTQYQRCGPANILNVVTGKCEDFSCAPGFKLSGTNCVREMGFDPIVGSYIDSSKFYSYLTAQNASLYLLMKENVTVELKEITQMFESNFNSTNESFVTISKNKPHVLKRKQTLSYNNFMEKESKLLQVLSAISMLNSVAGMVISSVNIDEITLIYGFDLSRHFSGGKICASNPLPVPNISSNLNYNDSQDTNFILSLTKGNIKRNVFQCSSYHSIKNCSLSHLEVTQYNISNTKTMKIMVSSKEGNITLEPKDYLPKAEGIAVCQNLFRVVVSDNLASSSPMKSNWQEEFHDIQGYLAFSLNIVSIVSGIFFIVANMILKELRRHGSDVILGIAISVLISDLLYIMANVSMDNVILCKSTGVLLHIILMAINLWAMIWVFDLVYQTMITKVSRSNSDGKMYLLEYFLASHVPAVIVVGICVVLDEADMVAFSYGNSGACWIGSYYASLVTFLIPVTLGYALSFTGCIMMLRYLKRQKVTEGRSTLEGSRCADINLITVATKITVMLGLVEVLGFIQTKKAALNGNETISHAAFALLYNIMRAMRGTFILIFHVTNTRTLMLYRRWREDKNSDVNISNITLDTIPSASSA